jgi:hypothetical protein
MTVKRTDLRKKSRRQLHYRARIQTSAEGSLRPCSISDISEGGARIELESEDEELPPRFVLLLSKRGEPQRNCRLIWRTGTTVGVKFADVQS